MLDKDRQFRRLNKVITTLYCIADVHPKEWDMSVIKNISVGGVMFMAPGDLLLRGKIVELKIGIPEIAPHVLFLEAMVVDVQAGQHPKVCEVRAKFINVSDENKVQLSIIERLINSQEKRNK